MGLLCVLRGSDCRQIADETERRESVWSVIPWDFTKHAVGHFIVYYSYDPVYPPVENTNGARSYRARNAEVGERRVHTQLTEQTGRGPTLANKDE